MSSKYFTNINERNLLMLLAKKYDALEKEKEDDYIDTYPVESNITPDIVLSETFIG